jgi:hypothetical protein
MPRTVAILTGDLIGSTRASVDRVDATMDQIRTCARDLGQDTNFTPFRGDGWQLQLSRPGDCLAASLYILAWLKARLDLLETRVSVGIGAGAPVQTDTLATAVGPAFTASGRGLDAMRRGQVLAIDGDDVDLFQKQCFTFAGAYALRWSAEQARAIAMALSPGAMAQADPTQQGIAEMLGISRQAVGARLKAGGFAVLESACAAFRAEYDRRLRDPT